MQLLCSSSGSPLCVKLSSLWRAILFYRVYLLISSSIEIVHQHAVISLLVVNGSSHFAVKSTVALYFGLGVFQMDLLSLSCDFGSVSLVNDYFDLACKIPSTISLLLHFVLNLHIFRLLFRVSLKIFDHLLAVWIECRNDVFVLLKVIL